MNAEQEMKLLRLIQGVRDDMTRLADQVERLNLTNQERLRVAELVEQHIRRALELEESKT